MITAHVFIEAEVASTPEAAVVGDQLNMVVGASTTGFHIAPCANSLHHLESAILIGMV